MNSPATLVLPHLPRFYSHQPHFFSRQPTFYPTRLASTPTRLASLKSVVLSNDIILLHCVSFLSCLLYSVVEQCQHLHSQMVSLSLPVRSWPQPMWQSM